MSYITKGFHSRSRTREFFKPGDKIVPTKFELAQFPGKFIFVHDTPEQTIDPIDEEVVVVDYTALEAVQAGIKAFLESDTSAYDTKSIDKLKKNVDKKPETQEKTDKLKNSLETFYTNLTKAE